LRLYKIRLKDLLLENGWELNEIDDETEWWLEELWVITSSKQNWGYKLYLHFLVDLQYEGTNKSSAVWAVSALQEPAKSYTEVNDNVAEMFLQKGKFDENLNQFIQKINKHRNEKGLWFTESLNGDRKNSITRSHVYGNSRDKSARKQR